PVLPSPISVPAGSVLDPAGYSLERRLPQGNREFRSLLRAAWRALRLRSGQCGGARRNSDRFFYHAVAWEQTTESESRFKWGSGRGDCSQSPGRFGEPPLPFTSRREFPRRGFSIARVALPGVDG